MKHSSPNKWVYGGIIERVRWDFEESGQVRLWNGRVDVAHEGDVVLLFRTGAPVVTFAGVEHRGSCPA